MSKATPEPDVFRGRRVGKYEVLTRLSIGGMAELFLAFTTGPGGFRKFVVIKQILPDIASDEAFVHMFLDEARITAALNHPNVAQVYELGEEGGQYYLAMEYIAGQNLEHVVRRAARRGVPLPVGFSAKVIRDVCLALNYAHNFADLSTGRLARIVHRDISPKNIMVTYAGTVKVVDFGIAKARNRLIRTRVGMVKGTSGYMSPEQVRNGVIDGRTDLFATAVILYELLTGQRLFSANADLAMMKKIAEGDIAHPQKLNPGLSNALSAVVMKGLERNLRERFQNGGEMARALEKAYPNIADEDKTAKFMSELFPDRMKQAQALLESAGVGDSQKLYNAVEALREEPSDVPVRRSSSSSQHSISSKRVSSPPKSPSAEVPSSASVSKSRQARLSKERSASVSAEKQSAGSFKSKTPASRRMPKKPSAMKRWMVRVVVLAVLGAGVWAAFWGPFRSQVRPYVAQMAQLVTENIWQSEIKFIEAPPTESEEPDWVIKRREEEARLAKEREAIREIELSLQGNPEFQKLINDIDEQIRQLAQMEEEQDALKRAMKESKETSSSNTRRIDELEKKILALTNQLAANRVKKARFEKKTIQVVENVVDAGLGYFSISTSNPKSVQVYLKGSYLGTTPLVEVLIEEGMQEFQLMDSEGNRRKLVTPITRGKKTKVAIDVKTLPLVP